MGAWPFGCMNFVDVHALFSPAGSSKAGIAIGTGVEVSFLLMDKRFQHLAHHFEMIAVSGKLAFQIDQIGRRGVKTV